MTTHTDAPADDLVTRLNARADHYLRRAEIMAKYADTVDRSDLYAAIADGDADAEHVLAATMREAAARIRSLEAQRDEAVGLLRTLEDERKREGATFAHLKRAVAVAWSKVFFLDSLTEKR